MIKFEDALVEVLAHTKELERERLPITEACGRILREDIASPFDIPPFTNSAMDGFAVKYEDIKSASSENPVELEIAGVSDTGNKKEIEVKRGKAVKLFTGSPLPPGADTVVPVEYTEERNGKVFIYKSLKRGSNVREKGEEVKKGDILLRKGFDITPYEVGLLAQIDRVHIWVNSKPRVAIISTGDELAEIGTCTEGEGKIISSNNYMLKALLERIGAETVHLGIVKDRKDDIYEALSGYSRFDMVITTGGMSKGEKDYVKYIAEELGIDIRFHGVLIKPAKPVAFGIFGDGGVFFGLPGNPVSTAVAFDLLVYPALRKMMGAVKVFPERIKAKLIKDFYRKSSDRKEFLRVKVWFDDKEYVCMPLERQGSHMLTSLVEGNAYAIVDIGVREIKAGEYLEIIKFK